MNNLRLAAAAVLLCAGLVGCGRDANPSVNPDKIQLSTRRFDRDLAALDTSSLAAGLQGLRQKYPDFLGFYLDTLMGFQIEGNFTDTTHGVREGLRSFLTQHDYRGVFDSVAAHFPDTKNIEADLRKGFAYYQHYFPQRKIPAVVYFISGLNSWNAITYGDLLGIGLDMYLGPQYPFYASVGIPAYTTVKLKPSYIPADVFRTLYRDSYPFDADAQSLLSMMLQRGKEQYFLKKVVPFTDDTVRFGFTAAQLQWCRENEGGILNFFTAQDLLYETNLQKVSRFVTDGPASTGLPPEAPGNVGTYLGYRIVEEWMKEHDLTLQALLDDKRDSQRFFQESGFKPR